MTDKNKITSNTVTIERDESSRIPSDPKHTKKLRGLITKFLGVDGSVGGFGFSLSSPLLFLFSLSPVFFVPAIATVMYPDPSNSTSPRLKQQPGPLALPSRQGYVMSGPKTKSSFARCPADSAVWPTELLFLRAACFCLPLLSRLCLIRFPYLLLRPLLHHHPPIIAHPHRPPPAQDLLVSFLLGFLLCCIFFFGRSIALLISSCPGSRPGSRFTLGV